MDVLRTPDDRFADLPDFSFSPHYVEVPVAATASSDGHAPVHYLDEGPRDAPVVLLHARRTVVVLPLPQDDPGARRRRIALRRARPRRLRSLRQAGATHRLHLRAARRVDAVRALRRARPSRRDARRPGLGRPRSACVSSASIPIGSRGSSPRTRSSRRATTPPGDAFLNWQRFSQTVEDFPVGFIVNFGCTTDLTRRGRRGLRRALPRRDVQGRRAPVPDAGADESRRSGRGREPSRVGRAATFRPPVPHRVLGRGSDHEGRRPRVPARGAGLRRQPHTTIEGGGHFLQEDRGEELARVVAAFVRG